MIYIYNTTNSNLIVNNTRFLVAEFVLAVPPFANLRLPSKLHFSKIYYFFSKNTGNFRFFLFKLIFQK